MREVNGCRHTAPGLSVGFGVFMPIKGLVFPLKFLFCLGSLRCRPQAHQWRNSETQELCRDEISRILVSVIPVRRFWGRCPGESVAGLSPQVSWSTSALPSSASTAFSSVPRNHGALHNYLLNVMESPKCSGWEDFKSHPVLPLPQAGVRKKFPSLFSTKLIVNEKFQALPCSGS